MKMNTASLYSKKDPIDLSYQLTAPFLYAECSVFSVLSKTSVNIGAESTLKCHPSINVRAVERNLLNHKYTKAHTKSNTHKVQSITIKYMQVKMRKDLGKS